LFSPKRGHFASPSTENISEKFGANRLIFRLLFISFYGKFEKFAEKATFYFLLGN